MKRKGITLLLALALLLGCTACGGTRAASIHLKRTQGTVGVADDAGQSQQATENLGLYSGWQVDTRAESYAWIDLDEVKLTKLDQDSQVEITKTGGELELELKSGSLFFNITQPLEDDESLDIRTSTMVVGIRGTCGWVTEDAVALLEGKVSVTAGEQSATVNAGEMGVVTEDGTITVTAFGAEDIPAFVLDEVEDDEELLEAVTDSPSEDDEDDSGSSWPTVPGFQPAGGSEDVTLPGNTAEGEITNEGTEGNISWRVYDSGTLIISGTGDIPDYEIRSSQPWYSEIIRSVVIEPGVTSIGDGSFYYCTSLTSVTIPDSVTSIGNDAFSECGLTSVTIPDSVTSIGDNAFYHCTSLTSVTIPSSVTFIGNDAFSNCGLTSVTIPDSITSISRGAFFYCTSLTSVTIPVSVTSIGNSAFSGCGLTSVSIPDSIASISYGTFMGCRSLTSVTIPDSVTSIGDSAFSKSGLTSVTIPDSVTSIGSCAFQDCTSLTDVYFAGTQAQFEAISIGADNDCLLNATIHYGA